MHKLILFFLFICLSLLAHEHLIAQELDSVYHNNEEIFYELTFYSEEYPDWVILDSIGHSAEYRLPIPSQMSLQVYSVSGQQITTLFEGYKQAVIIK